MNHEFFMQEAINEAILAGESKDVPVGCVIVKDGKVIARGHNEKELRNLATAHAEIVTIERASNVLGSWYLDGCTMYVTLEPCVMCAGALVNARLERVVYGCADVRFGACETLYCIPTDSRLNHRLEVVGGVKKDECLALLQSFFKGLRSKTKTV